MTEQELIELCSIGESTTVQYKLDFTTQKSEITTRKELDTLDSTTQKLKTTTRKPLNTTQKRILKYLKNYPNAPRVQVAEALGDITENGVKFNIGLLQQHGYLRRMKGRKKGYYEIIE